MVEQIQELYGAAQDLGFLEFSQAKYGTPRGELGLLGPGTH